MSSLRFSLNRCRFDLLAQILVKLPKLGIQLQFDESLVYGGVSTHLPLVSIRV